MDNIIVPFMLAKNNVRGKLIRLGDALDNAVKHHEYPLPVASLLGELIMVVSVMGDLFKSTHYTTIQISGNGPVSAIIADYFDHGKIRGYANFDKDAFSLLPKKPTLSQLLGEAQIVVTMMNPETLQPFQAIVEMVGDNIAETFGNFFTKSVQIESHLKLAVGQHYVKNQLQFCGGGLFIQKLPENNNYQLNWDEAVMFTDTVTDVELLDETIPIEKLLYNLYNELEVWRDESSSIEHGCKCSTNKFNNIFANLSPEQREEYTVDGKITIKCEFCSREENYTD